MVEATVDLGTGEVAGWVDHDGARPALGFGESLTTILALRDDPAFQAALEARGITDVDQGADRPLARRPLRQPGRGRGGGWPAASPTTGRTKGDNGYARPIEGLQALVDMASGEVLEVTDTGAVPVPSDPGSYFPEDHPPRPGLAPLVIAQPEGVGLHHRRERGARGRAGRCT